MTKLSAQERASLIRLAQTLPKGSDRRRTILAGLSTGGYRGFLGHTQQHFHDRIISTLDSYSGDFEDLQHLVKVIEGGWASSAAKDFAALATKQSGVRIKVVWSTDSGARIDLSDWPEGGILRTVV